MTHPKGAAYPPIVEALEGGTEKRKIDTAYYKKESCASSTLRDIYVV